MKEVTFFEAWRLWVAGELSQEMLLGPWQILWWGRIGKIVQFLAALTLILEIIGPQKLQQFGNSLELGITWSGIKDCVKNISKGVYHSYKALLPMSTSRSSSDFDLLEKMTGITYTGFLILVFLVF